MELHIMRTTVKVVALLCLGVALSGIGIKTYSNIQNDQVDRIACTTVSTKDAVLNVERDLLTRQHTSEEFGKYRITIGSVLFHNETIDSTHVKVPFTLSSRRGISEFEASMRCSDLSNIEYSKL